jgi:hypothetical protein
MKNIKAYSLVELSITLTILAVLLAGSVSIFVKKNDSDSMKITIERIAKIEQAIKDYVDIYGFIPCPAQGNALETSINFGDSQSSAAYSSTTFSCTTNLTNNVGMVPVRNLGLEDKYAYDGWNRKFTFKVATGLGSATDFTNNVNFTGDIRISDLNGVERTDYFVPAPNNQGAAYVLISHGPDGLGAWGRNSASSPTLPATTSPEYQNTRHFVTPSNFYFQDDVGYTFNDIVVFKRKKDLLAPRNSVSPIYISSNTCSNANLIANYVYNSNNISINGGTPPTINIAGNVTGVYNVPLTQYGGSLSGNNLWWLLQQSAIHTQTLCNNPPVSIKNYTINNYNSSSSCVFNPKSISGLALWLDSSDPNGNGISVSNGTAIATWYDKSGNNNNAIGQSGNPAIYYTSSPYMNYNGSNKGSIKIISSLYGSSQNAYTFTPTSPTNFFDGNYTVFIIEAFFANKSSSGVCPMLISNCGNFNNPFAGFVSLGYCVDNTQYSGGNNYNSTRKRPTWLHNVNYTVLPASDNWGYNPALWTLQFDTSQGTKMSVRTIDNRVSQIHNPNYNDILGDSSGYTTYRIGQYYDGFIGEILIYKNSLTTMQVKMVESYLARRWLSGECP